MGWREGAVTGAWSAAAGAAAHVHVSQFAGKGGSLSSKDCTAAESRGAPVLPARTGRLVVPLARAWRQTGWVLG